MAHESFIYMKRTGWQNVYAFYINTYKMACIHTHMHTHRLCLYAIFCTLTLKTMVLFRSTLQLKVHFFVFFYCQTSTNRYNITGQDFVCRYITFNK